MELRMAADQSPLAWAWQRPKLQHSRRHMRLVALYKWTLPLPFRIYTTVKSQRKRFSWACGAVCVSPWAAWTERERVACLGHTRSSGWSQSRWAMWRRRPCCRVSAESCSHVEWSSWHQRLTLLLILPSWCSLCTAICPSLHHSDR